MPSSPPSSLLLLIFETRGGEERWENRWDSRVSCERPPLLKPRASRSRGRQILVLATVGVPPLRTLQGEKGTNRPFSERLAPKGTCSFRTEQLLQIRKVA